MSTQLTKMSIFMAESGLVEKNGQLFPVIYYLGRDENLKRKKIRLSVQPFFHMLERDYRALKDTSFFKRTLKVKGIEGSIPRSINKQLLTKILVNDCGIVKDNIHSINKWNKIGGPEEVAGKEAGRWYYTYEADLSCSDLLPLRHMVDNNIRCSIETDGVEIFNPIPNLDIPQRRWYLDFESYTFKESSNVVTSLDPLIMVSIWDNYLKVMYTYYVVNPKWSVKRQTEQCFEPYKLFTHIIKSFNTVPKFLDAIMELLLNEETGDPDKILAWNLLRYDILKWKQQVDFNRDCHYPFKLISPLKSVNQGNRIQIKGRILFDLMIAYKQFTDQELPSYALAAISEEENLGYRDIPDIWNNLTEDQKVEYADKRFEKIPFKGSSGQCWDSYPEIVFQRNVLDVLIIVALDYKYGITETYEELQYEFGTLPQEIFVRNRIIDTALMRLVNGRVALKTTQFEKEEKSDNSKLLGARVVEPEPDEYENAAQFDFGAEYPSIIEGFNISPETYRSTPPDKPHYHIHYEDPVHGVMDFYFIKENVQLGLLPELIKFFKAKRKYYKGEQDKAIANGEPEHVIKKWDRRQYNVKKSTNAIYGVMDYPKFRLHKKECTQATAIIGRISIEELTVFLDSIGYKLLYGDTDSIFVLLHSKTPQEQYEESLVLQKKLNDHLTKFFSERFHVSKAPAELGFKAIYDLIMFIGKKNYAASKIWDEKKGWVTKQSDKLDIKGIASVRSDASKLERKALEKELIMILSREKTEVIKAYIDGVMEDFKARKFNYMEISYPAQLKRSLKKDKKGHWISGHKTSLPAHVKAAIYCNLYLNTDYSQGDKPRRLPVKLPKLKTMSGQRTLMMKSVFPSSFTYYGLIKSKRKGVIVKRHETTYDVTDISVTEDMNVPSFFLGNIDYERIGERLEKKLRVIFDVHNKVKEQMKDDRAVRD